MMTTNYFQLHTAVASDVGRSRRDNQDACLALPDKGLFILADGMGGHQAGEIAAGRVVQKLPLLLEHAFEQRFGGGQTICSQAIQQTIRQAAVELNYDVFDEGCRQPETNGMGSTVVLAWLFGRQAHLMHLGDSRIYLWRAGSLRQLTEDHTVGMTLLRLGQITEADMQGNPQLRQLSRCIGMPIEAEADVSNLLLETGDRLLLCSDGLTNMVTDEQITEMIGRYPDLETASHSLIAAANAAGGFDNISVILIGVNESE